MLAAIVVAAHRCGEAEAQLREAVAEARYAFVAWSEIGKVLGITAQAAEERFSRRGRSGAEVRMMLAGVPRSPKGSVNINQSLFKSSLTIRLEAGESLRDAVDNAAADVRRNSPAFEPTLPESFFARD